VIIFGLINTVPPYGGELSGGGVGVGGGVGIEVESDLLELPHPINTKTVKTAKNKTSLRISTPYNAF
jgi:hypothetical protein